MKSWTANVTGCIRSALRKTLISGNLVVDWLHKIVLRLLNASPAAIIFIGLFIGLLFIMASVFLGVFKITAVVPDGLGGGFPREVGYIQALHWWFASFVLFPLFLLFLKSSASSAEEYLYEHGKNKLLLSSSGEADPALADKIWSELTRSATKWAMPLIFVSLIIGVLQWWFNSGCWLFSTANEWNACSDIVAGPTARPSDGLPFWREWGMAATFDPRVPAVPNAIFVLANYLYYGLLWGFVYLHFVLFLLFVIHISNASARGRHYFVQDRAPLRDPGPMLLPLLGKTADPLGIRKLRQLIWQSKFIIILFVAIGIYFILYNSFLQQSCVATDAAQCRDMFTYLVEQFQTEIYKKATQPDGVALVLKFIFQAQKSTVYNYFSVATVIAAAFFLAVAVWEIRKALESLMVVGRRLREDPEGYSRYYENVSKAMFSEGIGEAHQMMRSVSMRDIVVFTAATSGATILSYAGIIYLLYYFPRQWLGGVRGSGGE